MDVNEGTMECRTNKWKWKWKDEWNKGMEWTNKVQAVKPRFVSGGIFASERGKRNSRGTSPGTR